MDMLVGKPRPVLWILSFSLLFIPQGTSHRQYPDAPQVLSSFSNSLKVYLQLSHLAKQQVLTDDNQITTLQHKNTDTGSDRLQSFL